MFPILLTATAAAAMPNLAQQPKDCPKIEHYATGKAIKPHTLDKEPPAAGYYTVLRTDRRGCVIPVKFKEASRR